MQIVKSCWVQTQGKHHNYHIYVKKTTLGFVNPLELVYFLCS